jgi:hypothetical protein
MPADIRRATVLDRMRLLQVPFWRVEVSVDGFHVAFSTLRLGEGNIGIPIPLRASRHESRVLMVSGRSSFPYEVKVPGGAALALGGVPPLTVGAEELIPRAAGLPTDGEIVACDVARELAQQTAQHALLRALEPAHALYSKYQPSLGSFSLVRYPVFYLRYRYDGEARRYASEDCALAISARTGQIITRRHPSGARSAAGKLRRMFSLGW